VAHQIEAGEEFCRESFIDLPEGAVCREYDDEPAEIVLHPLGVRERSCLEEIEEEVPDGGFSFLELIHQENSGIGRVDLLSQLAFFASHVSSRAANQGV